MGAAGESAGQALLDVARAAYATRLPSRIAEIAELVQKDAWADARRAAHKLRGSASTYGFVDVGSAAAALEETILAGGDKLDSSAKATVLHLLENARAAAVRSNGGNG